MSLSLLENLDQLLTKTDKIKDRELLVLAQAARSYLANLRVARAHTKTRGEISGGGRKPWRQKGTGRARAGSIRSPLWRGGGTIFGPSKNRNFSQKLNSQFKAKTLLLALQDKLNLNRLWQISKWPTDGKTKSLASVITKLERPVLLVSSENDNQLNRAAHNLPRVAAIIANQLYALQVMTAQNVVFDEAAIQILNQRLNTQKTTQALSAQASATIKTKTVKDKNAKSAKPASTKILTTRKRVKNE